MSVRVFRGTERLDGVPADDRGLAYGDGVFETLLVHDGQAVWWTEHWQRLLRGAQTLRIAAPDPDWLREQCIAMVSGVSRGVLKVILTRGAGARGYRQTAGTAPTLALSLHAGPPVPTVPPAPLTLRWCNLQLSIQPALAGIKHLNRLEQVLARAEWGDETVDEGLLCDTDGRVVCATSANLFVHRGDRWLTPPVHRCGIAGVARGWLLANIAGSEEAELRRPDVLAADSIFLCNSVRGILAIGRLDEVSWPSQVAVADLRRQLGSAQPGFEFQEQ